MAFEFDAGRHIYRLNGADVPGVTSVMQDVGVVDFSMLTESTRTMALARGRKIHTATQFDDEGDLDESGLDPQLLGYVAAWRKFRAETGFTPDLIEHRGYHEALRYAGTLDRRGIINGKPAILDIKSNHAPYWTKYQTAAYAAFFPDPRTYHRIAVELHKDGTYKAETYLPSDYLGHFQGFMAMLMVRDIKREGR